MSEVFEDENNFIDQDSVETDCYEGIRHQCPLCNANFVQKQSLKSHIRAVHEEMKPLQFHSVEGKRHQCLLCNSNFVKKQSLKSHIITVHEEKKPLNQCQLCDSSFVMKKSLKSHINIVHEGKKPLQFHSFEFKKDYESKQKSSKKSYSCDQCKKHFTKAFNLQQHINGVHLKIKAFKCEYENCEFICSQKQNLKQHISGVHEHSEQLKLFACEDCDQIFKKMNHLKVHKEAVHDGIKHHCENCTKSFSTKSHLHRHMRKKHDEKIENYNVNLENQVL